MAVSDTPMLNWSRLLLGSIKVKTTLLFKGYEGSDEGYPKEFRYLW